MKILFDFEVTETAVPITPKTKSIVKELRRIVEQRLAVLNKEISQHDGAIVINLTGTLKGPIGWAVFGFPDGLKAKIVYCLPESDFAYALGRADVDINDPK